MAVHDGLHRFVGSAKFHEKLSERHGKVKQLFIKLFREGIANGEFKEIDPDFTADAITSAVIGIIRKSIFQGEEIPIKSYTEKIIAIFYYGIAIEKQGVK